LDWVRSAKNRFGEGEHLAIIGILTEKHD